MHQSVQRWQEFTEVPITGESELRSRQPCWRGAEHLQGFAGQGHYRYRRRGRPCYGCGQCDQGGKLPRRFELGYSTSHSPCRNLPNKPIRSMSKSKHISRRDLGKKRPETARCRLEPLQRQLLCPPCSLLARLTVDDFFVFL